LYSEIEVIGERLRHFYYCVQYFRGYDVSD